MRHRHWQKTNCEIKFPTASRKKVGESSITRQPIYAKGNPSSQGIRVWLQEAGNPVHNLFPGADETKESLIGHFPTGQKWPEGLSNDAIVNVKFDCGSTYRAQVLRGAFGGWADDHRKGRKGGLQRSGERIYLSIVRENQT